MSVSCGWPYCNFKCDGVFSCQDLMVEENTWSIECTQTSSCLGITARCSRGKSCKATCVGMSACHNGKFDGQWNNLDCIGDSACRDLTIQASEYVRCTGTGEDICRGLNANCTDSKSCFFHCYGTSACAFNRLNGIWNAIKCIGTSSCQGLYVEECIESIKCEEDSSCRDLIATCTDGKSCLAKCDGVNTCSRAKLYGTWDMNCTGIAACQGANIALATGSVQRPSSGQVTIIFAIVLSQLIF